MPQDTQIFVGKNRDGSSDYDIPSSAEIRVKVVNANFVDNGAGADWCPAVVMFSDSGSVIARALLPDVQVAAGDDAEVSFFPGVKPGGAGGITGVASGLWQGHSSLVTLVSGAATTLTWSFSQSNPGSFPPILNPTGTNSTFSVSAWRVYVQYTVEFPAGNYDRYIEVNQLPSTGNIDPHSPIQVRSQITPDGDSLTITCVAGGSPFTPSNLNLVAYQASGVNQTVSGFLYLTGWPIALPSETWS